ncbi:MAG TPA: hypothetical protein VFW94_23580 [Candidatus Acidoferrales bacterium]|nr:hypothetical protein [Candidatus Acidoferrales bacterium]
MGLDMYLTAKKYLSELDPAEKKAAEAIAALLGVPLTVETVSLRAAYWRKANAIHKWFVAHVSNGEDDCQEHDVSDDDLRELLAACEAVLADRSKAAELLPTQDGFFYGGTAYGDGYFSTLEDTRQQLQKLLVDRRLNDAFKDFYFTYRASW